MAGGGIKGLEMNTKIPVTSCDKVQERLRSLHDRYGLSFRTIAYLGEFRPIPAGTLCTIYKTGRVPNKWCKRLGLQEYKTAPACSKCGEVHVTKTCTTLRKLPSKWADMPVKAVRKAIDDRKEW